MFSKLRKHLLHFRSPIRWGTFALLIAIFLFCVEIWLSLYQLYLSLYGGGVMMGGVVEVIIIIGLILVPISALLVLFFLFYTFFLWRKHKSVDDTLQTVKAIQKEIKALRNDLKRGNNNGE